jgi:hypothetical protein
VNAILPIDSDIAPTSASRVAQVNGRALHAADAAPDAVELRQRACTELLRQAAQHEGLLDPRDEHAVDGAISEAASAAIEALLARMVEVPDPSEEACRRHFLANTAKFAHGERAHVHHLVAILQHRHLGGRIQDDQRDLLLPRLDGSQLGAKLLLVQGEAHLPRERAKREMAQA